MSEHNGENSAVYAFGDFRVDASKRVVCGKDGEPLPLKAKAFETLLFLVEHPGRVIERDEILGAVWPDTVVEENNLTQHISSLRRLFGEKPDEHKFIATIPGHGYKFVAEVRSADFGVSTATVPSLEKTGAVSRKRLLLLGAGVIALLFLLGLLYRFETPPASTGPIKQIAVLPFKPVDEQNRDVSLEWGMTHDLITKLSDTDGLVVRPYSAVKRYSSPEQNVTAAGRELEVDAVIDGTIQLSAGKVRIYVELVRVSDSKQLWSSPFDDYAAADIFSVQDKISERIANMLRVNLSENAKKRYTENIEAYRLYQRGRINLYTLAPANVKVALGDFQKAIEIDPNYALAYAGVSDCYRSLILSGEGAQTDMSDLATSAAETAIKIDPELADAQASLGYNYFWFKHDWIASEAAYKRAIEIDPNLAVAHHYYSHLLSNLGRHDEAITEAETVRKLDPYSPYFATINGLVYHQAGDYERAFASFNEAEQLDSRIWLPKFFEAVAYTDLKRYDDAITAARKASELNPSQSISPAYECVALARSGRRDEARKVLNNLLKRSTEGFVPPYHIAIAYLGLGDRMNALLWLEKSYANHDVKMVFLKSDRIWEDLRNEPRFIELMRKMRL